MLRALELESYHPSDVFDGLDIKATAFQINELGKTYTPEGALPLPVTDWLRNMNIREESPIHNIVLKYPALAYGVETGIWNPPKEDPNRYTSLMRHVLGVADRAGLLITPFSTAPDSELAPFAKHFHAELFRGVPIRATRDSIWISHIGEPLARAKYAGKGKAWSGRAMETYRFMVSVKAPEILLDLQLGEMGHTAKDRINVITQLLSNPQYMIAQRADWMFGQKPMGLFEWIQTLTTKIDALSYFPTLIKMAKKFDEAFSDAFGEERLLAIQNAPYSQAATEILTAYEAQIKLIQTQ